MSDEAELYPIENAVSIEIKANTAYLDNRLNRCNKSDFVTTTGQISDGLDAKTTSDKEIKTDMQRHLVLAQKVTVRSANQKPGLVQRRLVKFNSLKTKQLSPKLSPKSKTKKKSANIMVNKDKNNKNESELIKYDKNEGRTIKGNKVKEIINQLEANKDTDNKNDIGVKVVEPRNAFEALMFGKKTGDTLEKTSVRKKVKRLDSITSNESILKWVKKY